MILQDTRVRQSVTYLASFILIAATSLCPCGYFGSNERYCTCTPSQVRKYQLKASGPLIDRLDFILSLKSVGITDDEKVEDSAIIRLRTENARLRHRQRYGSDKINGNVPVQILLDKCKITAQQSGRLKEICFKEKWSNRTQVKIIRIARTISDLENTEMLLDSAIEEACKWKKTASLHSLQVQANS